VPAARQLEAKALAGDAASAIELFDWLRSGDGLPDDARRAASLVARACARSVQDACGRLGTLYLRGEGVAQDVAHGKKLLDAACEGGSAWSCARVGAERIYATTMHVDLVKGTVQLEAACAKGSVYGCDALLRAMKEKLIAKRDVATLSDRRFKGALAACKEHRTYDCLEWLDVLQLASRGPDDEWKVQPGQEISPAQLCAAGDYHACLQVAEPRLFGSWREACARGDSRGCNGVLLGDDIQPMCGKGDCQACDEVLGELRNKPGQPALLAIVDRACAMGCGRVCEEAVSLHPPPVSPPDTFEERQKAPRDRERYKWLRLACEAGSGQSCARLAAEVNDVGLYERACPAAPRFFSRSDLSAKACLAAADAYRSGLAATRDLAHAIELYERACRAGGASGYGLSGCRALGELVESRPNPDLPRALAYYAASCLPGEGLYDWESCFRARELTRRGVPADPEARAALDKRLTELLFAQRSRDGTAIDGGWQ
jgi:TPR repeat protein